MGGVSLETANQDDNGRKNHRFDKSAADILHYHAGFNPPEISSWVDTQQDWTGQVSSHDAYYIKQSRQQRKADNRRGNPRADQKTNRVDVHGDQGIDLFGYSHDADLGSHGGTGTTGNHDGGQGRSQFPDQGKRNRGPQHPLGPEFNQGIISLQPEHHTGKTSGQKNHEDRFRPDKIHLLDEFRHLERTCKYKNKSLNKKKGPSAPFPVKKKCFRHPGPAKLFSETY